MMRLSTIIVLFTRRIHMPISRPTPMWAPDSRARNHKPKNFRNTTMKITATMAIRMNTTIMPHLP